MGRLTRQSTLFDKLPSHLPQDRRPAAGPQGALGVATPRSPTSARRSKRRVAARNADCPREALHAFEQAAQVFTELNLESNVKVVETQRDHVLQMLAAQSAARL